MSLDLRARSMFRSEVELNPPRHRRFWLGSRALVASLIVSSAFGLQLGQAADLYSAEAEKSPPPVDAITRQWLQQRNRQEQERFRKRVAIPGATGPEIQAATPDRSLFAPKPPLASTPESREHLLLIA